MNIRWFLLFPFIFTNIYSAQVFYDDIKSELFQILIEGSITQNQYYYIIKELDFEPSCQEIRKIFEKSHGFSIKARNLVDTYCPKSAFLSKTMRYKRVSLNGSYQSQLTPENTSSTPSLLYLRLKHPRFTNRMSIHSNGLAQRQIKYSISTFDCQIGHIQLSGIPYLSDRSFWRYQNSLGSNAGIFFSEQERLNGMKFSLSASNHQWSIYGTWNQNHLNQQPLDALLYGGQWKFIYFRTKTEFQSQLNRFEFHSGPISQFLSTGLQVSSSFSNNIYNIGLVHSASTRSLAAPMTSRFLSQSLLFGEINDTCHNFRIKIFQANGDWDNPLGSSLFHAPATQVEKIFCAGKSEGGIHLLSGYPIFEKSPFILFNSPLKFHLSSQIRYHWHLKLPDFKYAHWHNQFKIGLLNNYIKFNMEHFIRHSAEYSSIGFIINKKWGKNHFSATYKHKFGEYMGKATNPISVEFSIPWFPEGRIKNKIRTSDIIDGFEKWEWEVFQVWNMGKQLRLINRLFLPFKNIRPQQTIKIKIHLDYKASWLLRSFFSG